MKSVSVPGEKSPSFIQGIAALLRLRPKKRANQSDRAAKSAAGKFNPSVSRSLADVCGKLTADGAGKLGVYGDAAFLAAVRAELPTSTATWLSSEFRDIKTGAAIPDRTDLTQFDALVCGGSGAAVRWRHALHQALRHRKILTGSAGVETTLPIHWVGENWEFCGGFLPVPAEADDAEALLFNHFDRFFGIRDPLQFHVTIYHGEEEKHFTRILEPNESLLLRLSDFFPQRRHAAAFSARVEHPVLTRGRHYRMRLCGDVFWRGSLTTLHSSHEFNRDPQRSDEFRLSAGLLRQGEMVVTVPNFDRNQMAGSQIALHDGARQTALPRNLSAYLQQASIVPSGDSDRRRYGCRYQGYGGSFWFALDAVVKPTNATRHGGSISGNHHVSVPWNDRLGMELPPAEAGRIKEMLDAGYMIEPHAVPVTSADDHLRFGFDCDSANPPSEHFLIYLLDESGHHLGTLPYHKTHWGPAFPEHFLADAEPALAAATRLAMVAPDWLKNGHTRSRYKLQADLVVEDRRTGDRDVTEFQSSWRNLGVAIPDFPHWLSPVNGIVGRSNLIGRLRHGEDLRTNQAFRTGLLIVNGSGTLAYRNAARATVIITNLTGRQREATIDLPALTHRIVWIDELIPDLPALLDGIVGGLLVTSPDADLNCQLLTTTEDGAISLQHLWGY